MKIELKILAIDPFSLILSQLCDNMIKIDAMGREGFFLLLYLGSKCIKEERKERKKRKHVQ